ncbi:glycosyl transferase family 1 [Neisseria meningitidis]|uniref:glycosyl transferase family 1 n=1 Tax=Neisseria meningitidis TaxID=487 RepID=UPI0002D8F8CB|nr:glycosyl transferase family 1 [Neisseria meningitidis]
MLYFKRKLILCVFFYFPAVFYSGLTKIRTRRRSRRQYKQYGTDSLGASAP